MVNVDNVRNESTFLFPRCYKAYENNKCYKLSIFAGIDFGNYHRIIDLIEPNLDEQIILLLNQLYSVKIKVIPNRKVFMQTHSINRMRGNQILFHYGTL